MPRGRWSLPRSMGDVVVSRPGYESMGRTTFPDETRRCGKWPGWFFLVVVLTAGALSISSGCRSTSGGKTDKASLPEIRVQDGAGQLFVYKSGDEFHTVTKIADVPVWARGWVRVLDPKVRGTAGGLVYVANLCAPGKGGGYEYQVVELAEFESKGPVSCGGTAAPTKVIAYVSTTCPVCAKALAYLKSRGIPFEAKTVDTDSDAAHELARKAAAAGMTVRGVPVFDIGGKLVAGFDPATIERLLGGR